MMKQSGILFTGKKIFKSLVLAGLLIPAISFSAESLQDGKKSIDLLNVSYDPTREFYTNYNKEFGEYWLNKTGNSINVKQSHGGSGKQGRAVIDGLEADVVTLALPYDIDKIAEISQKLPTDWQKKLENNSSPYTSTIVFLVRKGNPKGIKDWDDLVKDGVSVITPNPKTGGGARLNYLAAHVYALKKELGNLDNVDRNSEAFKKAEIKANEFVKKLYKNVPVLDSGARGSTNTFVQREIGDVLLTWENEAFLALNELGKGEYEIVAPSLSIKAEPPVAVVEENAKKHGTLDVSKAYLESLYSPEGQKLATKYYFRPYKPELANKEDLDRFLKIDLVTVDQVYGSFKEAQKRHFDDGGVFDSFYK